jgi:hypothetical protein
VFETISILPFSFWVVVALLVGGIFWSGQYLKDGAGIPMMVVIVTVAAWYVGDACYNDYANHHAKIFSPEILENAWWQVAWFLLIFIVATPYVHSWMNADHLKYRSGILQIAKHGVNYPVLQKQFDLLFKGCLIIWMVLVVIAAIRLKGEILYYFFPFLGYKAEPWGRGRMGSGFDAFLTVAFYFQLMVASTFGVVAAVSTNRRTCFLAILLCLVAWPYFIFDRTRNTMLAVVIPAVLSWVFLRLRGGVVKKIVVLSGCFVVINAWMAFVIANRSDMTIGQALKEKGFNLNNAEHAHHEGLNMFEELCWINTFIENGRYNPNWGARYFAELVNPIPRVIWPGKPLIGIDYAIARGQGGGESDQANVYATVSTGCIGQGVVNFGVIFGPAAAAVLMSIWVAILARQDLHIGELGRLPLYACGLILTFNLGRDITLITLYPFIFGSLVLWWIARRQPLDHGATKPNRNKIQPEPGKWTGSKIMLRNSKMRPGAIKRDTPTTKGSSRMRFPRFK